MDKFYEPYKPKPEGLWEKYAIIPFFLAFAAAGMVMGNAIDKQNQKDINDAKEYQEQCLYHKYKKTR